MKLPAAAIQGHAGASIDSTAEYRQRQAQIILNSTRWFITKKMLLIQALEVLRMIGRTHGWLMLATR